MEVLRPPVSSCRHYWRSIIPVSSREPCRFRSRESSTYQIQLIGNTSANYNFHLLATNTPVIVKQPRSQTVYSNASALFYVVCSGAGQTNFTFQWFVNGTNLPGEIAHAGAHQYRLQHGGDLHGGRQQFRRGNFERTGHAHRESVQLSRRIEGIWFRCDQLFIGIQ